MTSSHTILLKLFGCHLILITFVPTLVSSSPSHSLAMSRPLLSALLLSTPLLAAATNFGDHKYYPYEKCYNQASSFNPEWAGNACIDSTCRVPTDPADGNSMYCIPKDNSVHECASFKSNTAPSNVTWQGGR